MAEKVYNKGEVKRYYGDPPNSTFHYRIKTGAIPAPDVMLGPDTPGWSEGLITRHQKALFDQAARATQRRSQRRRAIRRGESAPAA